MVVSVSASVSRIVSSGLWFAASRIYGMIGAVIGRVFLSSVVFPVNALVSLESSVVGRAPAVFDHAGSGILGLYFHSTGEGIVCVVSDVACVVWGSGLSDSGWDAAARGYL